MRDRKKLVARAVFEERGLALFGTMLLILIMLTLGGASLVYSSVDLKATSHFRTGNEAFTAAESGILHALSTINQRMVLHFEEDIVSNWRAEDPGTLLGAGEHGIDGSSTLFYQTTVARHDDNPVDLGWIFAQGRAPMGALRRVKVLVRRSMIPSSPGAVYAYADNLIDARWDGSFNVDGRSVDADGNPDEQREVPGLSTRNDTNREAFYDALDPQKYDQVCGLESDCDGTEPSILNSGGPSEDDVNQIVADILANNPTCLSISDSDCVHRITDTRMNGGDLPIGTRDDPQIIHLASTSPITINGNWEGYGILIIDGPLKANGDMNFEGWVISRADPTTRHELNHGSVLSGSASLRGTVWTASTHVKIGGGVNVEFCANCLEFAANAGYNPNGSNLPRPMEVVAWFED